GPGCSGPADLAVVAGGSCIACVVGHEAVVTALRAEPDGFRVVEHPSRRVPLLHLHTADGIERVACPTTETFAVAVEPVEKGEDTEEEDVEEGRVVPSEMVRDDVVRSSCGFESQAAEDAFDD